MGSVLGSSFESLEFNSVLSDIPFTPVLPNHIKCIGIALNAIVYATGMKF